VGKLCQGVSRTGGNDKHIQHLFWPDGFCLRDGTNGLPAANSGGSFDMLPGSAKPAVDGADILRKNGDNGMFLGKVFHYGENLTEGTKGTAKRKTYIHAFTP
jgi:hypothetical protein